MPGKPSLLICLYCFRFASVDPAQNTAELIRMATCWVELVTRRVAKLTPNVHTSEASTSLFLLLEPHCQSFYPYSGQDRSGGDVSGSSVCPCFQINIM